MKKILILLVMCVVLTGCSLFGKDNNVDNQENDLDKTDIQEQENSSDFGLSDEKVEIDKNSYLNSLFGKLTTYANEIYNNGGNYKKYSKRNEAYFVTLNDLKNDFNYDISMFKDEEGKACDINNSGIFFDDDKKLGIEYPDESNPISVIIVGCQ